MALLAVVALNVNAEEKKAEKSNANKPVFTVIKENKITSIKNQSRSGTCWDYSTLSFLEAEILKKTGKTYDLCEAFVANKTYFDRAVQVVRMHGDCQFAQGGSAYDPIYCLKHYGICPEDAMPLPGTLYGDSLNNFNEFFDVMTPYVLSVAKSKTDKLSSQWKVALHGIIDASSVNAQRSSLIRERVTHRCHLHRAWKSIQTIMKASQAIHTTHSGPLLLLRCKTTGATHCHGTYLLTI